MRAVTRRALLVVLSLAGVQAGGWYFYRHVERSRAAAEKASFSYREINPPDPVPNLTFEDIDGNLVRFTAQHERAVLLHFWATWCAPCRAELPSLLAHAAADRRTTAPALLLVSLDENWAVIRHYFGGAVPPEVVRDVRRTATDALHVETLPETLLLRPPGAVVARMQGARDWQTDAARSTLSRLAGFEQ